MFIVIKANEYAGHLELTTLLHLVSITNQGRVVGEAVSVLDQTKRKGGHLSGEHKANQTLLLSLFHLCLLI